MGINVRELVKICVLKEGKKVSISIGNGFEYTKILLMELGKCEDAEIIQLINKYRKKKG